MKIATYILAYDGGYSPNPFHGWLTLACCKPAIRRTARPGDWVVGITPSALGHQLAYAMQVAEALTFEEYWGDPRFIAKRPEWTSSNVALRRGDNCYEPLGDGLFRQLPCLHWDNEEKRENPGKKARDLGGRQVLVARRFSYYGVNAQPIPEYLDSMIPGRGHRCRFTPGEKKAIVSFLEAQPVGVHGRPRHWPEDDGPFRELEDER